MGGGELPRLASIARRRIEESIEMFLSNPHLGKSYVDPPPVTEYANRYMSDPFYKMDCSGFASVVLNQAGIVPTLSRHRALDGNPAHKIWYEEFVNSTISLMGVAYTLNAPDPELGKDGEYLSMMFSYRRNWGFGYATPEECVDQIRGETLLRHKIIKWINAYLPAALAVESTPLDPDDFHVALNYGSTKLVEYTTTTGEPTLGLRVMPRPFEDVMTWGTCLTARDSSGKLITYDPAEHLSHMAIPISISFGPVASEFAELLDYLGVDASALIDWVENLSSVFRPMICQERWMSAETLVKSFDASKDDSHALSAGPLRAIF